MQVKGTQSGLLNLAGLFTLLTAGSTCSIMAGAGRQEGESFLWDPQCLGPLHCWKNKIHENVPLPILETKFKNFLRDVFPRPCCGFRRPWVGGWRQLPLPLNFMLLENCKKIFPLEFFVQKMQIMGLKDPVWKIWGQNW